MTRITTRACVGYTPEQMYELVNDAVAYPSYLPMCSGVKVRSQEDDSLTATITLAKGKIKLEFTTLNRMLAGRQIEMILVEGPFKHLRGTWLFEPAGNSGCEVSFDLEFEFSNPLLRVAFGGFFKGIAESLVGAFCDQAARLYGLPSSPANAQHLA